MTKSRVSSKSTNSPCQSKIINVAIRVVSNDASKKVDKFFEKYNGKNISVLGIEWQICIYKETDKIDRDIKGSEGACDTTGKNIRINCGYMYDIGNDVNDITVEMNLALRHEIIHAFLYESGLEESSCSTDAWATNEEMVDWFAHQFPKICEVYKELDIL